MLCNKYCILYRLYSKQHGFLKDELIRYAHGNFHHVTTFGCRHIALQIWWLLCNLHRSEWPKPFSGRCMYASLVPILRGIPEKISGYMIKEVHGSTARKHSLSLVPIYQQERKYFPRHWPFMRGIHRSPVNCPRKAQWRGALIFSLICSLNKRLSKQRWGWWLETPLRSLWCHCNDHSAAWHQLYSFRLDVITRPSSIFHEVFVKRPLNSDYV